MTYAPSEEQTSCRRRLCWEKEIESWNSSPQEMPAVDLKNAHSSFPIEPIP